jgi:hypothetical protein
VTEEHFLAAIDCLLPSTHDDADADADAAAAAADSKESDAAHEASPMRAGPGADAGRVSVSFGQAMRHLHILCVHTIFGQAMRHLHILCVYTIFGQAMRHLFERFDANGDGAISYGEFLDALKWLGIPADESNFQVCTASVGRPARRRWRRRPPARRIATRGRMARVRACAGRHPPRRVLVERRSCGGSCFRAPTGSSASPASASA